MVSLLPFLCHVKAATDGDIDDREKSSCMLKVSKGVSCTYTPWVDLRPWSN